MSANISINPMATSNAGGTFGVDWKGGFQGTAMPDPATRFALAGGILSSSETLPMWGGVALAEVLGGSTNAAVEELGPVLSSAASAAAITGFSTFDQAHAAIATPQSPVPLIYSGGQVNFYRLKSGARLWLPCSNNIGIAAGSNFNAQVSWDPVGRQVMPYIAAFLAQVSTSGSYVSGTGVLTLNFATAPVVASGVWVGLSGFTGTAAQLNGQSFQVLSYTATTQITLQLPAGLTITNGDLSTGTTVAGGGALGIQGILAVSLSKSIAVNYAPSTGFATWNRQGNTLLALL